MRLLVSVAAAIWILSAARIVLQPIAIAILIWFLLTATARFYHRKLPGSWAARPRLAKAGSGLTIGVALLFLGIMTVESVAQIRRNLPAYEANLDRLLTSVTGALGFGQQPNVARIVEGIDFSSLLLSVAGSAAGFLSAFIIVVCYVAFLFVEADAFPAKLAAMVRQPDRRQSISAILGSVQRSIETYLGVQCVIGLIQAAVTYAVLAFVGVDAPMFWAVLIFALSFIPTIGTLVGIVFPSLMALIQFESLTPFLIVAPTLAVLQLFCSNWLQPRMMGRQLNLSPLAVFIAIFAGAAVWGIVGALVAVPVLSVTMIACAHLPDLRPIAIALSADGRLPESARTPPEAAAAGPLTPPADGVP
jgi:predicted PurR-regulated permease PerM